MKNTTWASGILLGVMLGSGAQAQTNTFHITLDTTGLYQTFAGDYLFDLQLNGTHGSRARISGLQWGGGSLFGTPDLSGAVTVKSPSDIVLGATDASNIYNEFTQAFDPGSEIAFDVRFDAATYNPGDQFPDLFSFGMIETTGDIASTGPNGFEYATLELPLGTNAFTAGDFATYQYTAVDSAGLPSTFTARVQAVNVPEPGIVALLASLATGGVLAARRYRARRAQTTTA